RTKPTPTKPFLSHTKRISSTWQTLSSRGIQRIHSHVIRVRDSSAFWKLPQLCQVDLVAKRRRQLPADLQLTLDSFPTETRPHSTGRFQGFVRFASSHH